LFPINMIMTHGFTNFAGNGHSCTLGPFVNFRVLLSARIIEEEESRIKAMCTKWYQDCRNAL
jgi:hypothetical protein